jgi:hypothetical protein
MTFSLCRLRFVELYRRTVDNMQSPTGYTFVTEMDTELSRALSDVPVRFGSSASNSGHVKGLELTLCLIMGETRRLRLHRPFLFQGYRDKRYTKSREQCVHSARAILNHLKSNREQSAILFKWWIVTFYGFAAVGPNKFQP